MVKIEQASEIVDISLTAYLLYRGANVMPRTLPSGRIAFRVTGTELDAWTDEYYNNPQIRLLDYMQYFKKIKSMIYEAGGVRR